MRLALRAVLGLAAVATFLASLFAIVGSPLAAPYRARTEAELRVVLDAALARELTTETVSGKIRAALDRGEADEAAVVLRLADTRGVAVGESERAEVAAAVEEAEGWSACLSCAFDPENCPDLTRVAACNLPLELTPVGDLNAVRRALSDYLAGDEIDRIDLSLGVVGLAATAAIVTSAGSSATVKVGATALRVARRAGAVPKPLLDEIAGLGASALRLDRTNDVLRGPAGLLDLAEPVAAARLSAAAVDMGKLAERMPLGDAFAVLKSVESTDDLARAARAAEAAGGQTRGVFAVLGPGRVLRLADRLAGAVLLFAALVTALAGQILSLLLWMLRRALRAPGGQRAGLPPRFRQHAAGSPTR